VSTGSRGRALDVLSTEPARADYPLLGLDNLVVTPHAAFYSEESIAEVRRRPTLHVCLVLGGAPPPNIVNRDVIEQQNYRLRATMPVPKAVGPWAKQLSAEFLTDDHNLVEAPEFPRTIKVLQLSFRP
jgi:D-isomer specific 2-hydroxyacid dehydrogenase, NAD binding domain